jgi:trk system potassium uptake protein TrkA
VGDVRFPSDTALVAIIRDTRVITPSPDDSLEAGDELMFVSSPDQEEALELLLGG